jgi:hypothetical protein
MQLQIILVKGVWIEILEAAYQQLAPDHAAVHKRWRHDRGWNSGSPQQHGGSMSGTIHINSL